MRQYAPQKGDLRGNWDKMISLIKEIIGEEDPTGDEVVNHVALLDSIKRDEERNGDILLGLLRAPAAKGNHHAYEGGLMYHLLEMWQVYCGLRAHYGVDLLFEDCITDARVLKAIIYHDIHKAYLTFRLIDADEWQTDYCNHETDQLMGSDMKSLWIITQVGIHPDPQQINALINAEGGYAKIKTRWVSSLAKLCYTLDELSGNVLSRIDTRTVLDLRTPYRRDQ